MEKKKITTELFFEAMRLLAALNIKDEVKDLTREKTEGDKMDAFEYGYEFLMRVFEKAVQVKSEACIYDFVANVLDKTPDEIRNGNVIEIIDELIEVANVEEWKALFSRAAGLIMKK